MSKIVEIAKAEIGNVEIPKNSNKTKYGKWFGFDGVPWCGIFVSWCYAQAGHQLSKIGFSKGFAGCQTAVAYFKKNKCITNNPQPGDIVFFDWNKDGRYDHTGLFVKWINENEFITIEGNTSIGNDSNGGIVMERKRNKSVALFVTVKTLLS
ncbi:CHAP domain-containing protein [Flavobacterium sediminilitoris]|uniref:CHAP domain-containing protein n=1 Tax=Flavobacterium sediminilitoris TaxID=2024526 RepID=A0ABY4HLS1_9FLAO|nr:MULTISPECIES: CHAP domain-containing protein [Flavobacterium]UOX32424.1 CHAP domain-containing protein [Flavobacterium sediminilitoris]